MRNLFVPRLQSGKRKSKNRWFLAAFLHPFAAEGKRMSRRSAKYPRRRHERKTMRAVGDAGPCGVIAALTQQRRKAILARDAGAAAGMGAEAIRCTAICNIWVFEGYRAAGYCAVSRAGSLETCGFKQTFWSLLGLWPKVTRAWGCGTLSCRCWKKWGRRRQG